MGAVAGYALHGIKQGAFRGVWCFEHCGDQEVAISISGSCLPLFMLGKLIIMMIHKYDIWIDFVGIAKGLWYQRWLWPYYSDIPRPRWCMLDRNKLGYERKYWCHIWTPKWHKGRGVYVT